LTSALVSPSALVNTGEWIASRIVSFSGTPLKSLVVKASVSFWITTPFSSTGLRVSMEFDVSHPFHFSSTIHTNIFLASEHGGHTSLWADSHHFGQTAVAVRSRAFSASNVILPSVVLPSLLGQPSGIEDPSGFDRSKVIKGSDPLCRSGAAFPATPQLLGSRKQPNSDSIRQSGGNGFHVSEMFVASRGWTQTSAPEASRGDWATKHQESSASVELTDRLVSSVFSGVTAAFRVSFNLDKTRVPEPTGNFDATRSIFLSLVLSSSDSIRDSAGAPNSNTFAVTGAFVSSSGLHGSSVHQNSRDYWMTTRVESSISIGNTNRLPLSVFPVETGIIDISAGLVHTAALRPSISLLPTAARGVSGPFAVTALSVSVNYEGTSPRVISLAVADTPAVRNSFIVAATGGVVPSHVIGMTLHFPNSAAPVSRPFQPSSSKDATLNPAVSFNIGASAAAADSPQLAGSPAVPYSHALASMAAIAPSGAVPDTAALELSDGFAPSPNFPSSVPLGESGKIVGSSAVRETESAAGSPEFHVSIKFAHSETGIATESFEPSCTFEPSVRNATYTFAPTSPMTASDSLIDSDPLPGSAVLEETSQANPTAAAKASAILSPSAVAESIPLPESFAIPGSSALESDHLHETPDAAASPVPSQSDLFSLSDAESPSKMGKSAAPCASPAADGSRRIRETPAFTDSDEEALTRALLETGMFSLSMSPGTIKVDFSFAPKASRPIAPSAKRAASEVRRESPAFPDSLDQADTKTKEETGNLNPSLSHETAELDESFQRKASDAKAASGEMAASEFPHESRALPNSDSELQTAGLRETGHFSHSLSAETADLDQSSEPQASDVAASTVDLTVTAVGKDSRVFAPSQRVVATAESLQSRAIGASTSFSTAPFAVSSACEPSAVCASQFFAISRAAIASAAFILSRSFSTPTVVIASAALADSRVFLATVPFGRTSAGFAQSSALTATQSLIPASGDGSGGSTVVGGGWIAIIAAILALLLAALLGCGIVVWRHRDDSTIPTDALDSEAITDQYTANEMELTALSDYDIDGELECENPLMSDSDGVVSFSESSLGSGVEFPSEGQLDETLALF
jgi:hypothetical protein